MAKIYNDNDMTVILAGICENGKGAIIVADRQRTLDDPRLPQGTKLESNEIVKIKKLNNYVYLATSGTENYWTEVLLNAKREIGEKDKPKKVKAILLKHYRILHQEWLTATVLVPLGYSSFTDYNTRCNKELPPQRIEQIDCRLAKSIGIGEMIIVCRETESYQIYGLQDPGLFKLASFGHAVTGSGTLYVGDKLSSEHKLSMSQDELRRLLLDCKEMAEQDPGVGKLTQEVSLSI